MRNLYKAVVEKRMNCCGCLGAMCMSMANFSMRYDT